MAVDYNNPNDMPIVDYDINKVPPEIREMTNGVEKAIYGWQNKAFIKQGMDKTGILVNQALSVADGIKSRQDSLEVYTDTMMIEMTDKDVISAPEIIQARGGKATLGERLDDTTAQLAHIEVEVEKFGAVGDGITDDSQAFVDGFAYVTEHHLTLSTQRGKTYIIDNVIVEGGNNFGFNSKGVLKRPDNLPKPSTPSQATKTLRFVNCTNFYISEIHLDGNHYNNHCIAGSSPEGNSSSTGYNQGGYGQEWRHCLVFNGCEDFKVDYISILNPSGDGVSFARETYRGVIGDIYGKSLDQNGTPIDLGRNLVTIANGVKDLQINSINSFNIGHYYMPGGLDIEPDDFDIVSNTSVENVYINNVYVLTGGTGGVGIFDNYNNGAIKNVVINQLYSENYRDAPSFPLLIAGSDNVVIHNAHTIEHSKRGYSTQIGREKDTKNVYLPNLIAEGGMLGLFLQGHQSTYETKNVHINVEFRNTRDSMIHFAGKNDGVNINIKGGFFNSPENVNRVIYVSPETVVLKNFNITGSIPQKTTNGGKILFFVGGGEFLIENIHFNDLDASGWIERARELNQSTFNFNPLRVTNITLNNCLGITALNELKNAIFNTVKGTYITNLNPTILTDDLGSYIIKGWVMTKTAFFILDGQPVEDKIYLD